MDRPGSEQEFDLFYEAMRRPLLGQAFLLTGNLQEAEDIIQEALVRAWRNWRRVSQLEDSAAWTRRVVHNLAISHFRHQKALLSHASTSVDVTHELSSLDLDLVRALRRLPPNQRRALVLTAIGGLKVSQVANEMKVREGTVRVWLSRARSQLADLLDVH
jgi:RNA polymerase sigma factor (sigma-70 family)